MQAEKPAQKPICLIVDDSRVIRVVARRILQEIGLEVSEAETAEAALGFCQKSLPDILLLDWNMPGRDGLSFLKSLRALPGGDKPKAIFCSIEADIAHIRAAVEAGADEYIMKPFDREIVESKLDLLGLLP